VIGILVIGGVEGVDGRRAILESGRGPGVVIEWIWIEGGPHAVHTNRAVMA